ncbi:DNA/RNA polymerases superfamily protein [Gossypium australe]|uniref:DNA/RNA polymerases superfamily protein n=1 Tax=Gossypium australe TaxID=47621 RepID=A0A5B6UYY0_9ROSI|nr:DNA/RNA polymerases superfamily protein [Gossypium australe]
MGCQCLSSQTGTLDLHHDSGGCCMWLWVQAFHPQTDGQSERIIQILEDMLRSCVIDFKGSWEDYLPLVEFAYNNNYQSSI